MKIELPIESERLVIRPLVLEDAADLAEDPAWIQSKIDRYERDGGMSLWAAVDKESGRGRGPAVGGDRGQAGDRPRLRRRRLRAPRVLEKLGFTRHGETNLEGEQYAFFSLSRDGRRKDQLPAPAV